MKPPFLPIAALAFVLVACTQKQNPEKEAVFAAIQAHLQAVEQENIDAVMATLHPATPGLEQQRQENEAMFKKYDLKFEIVSMKLESLTDTEAKVASTQKALRVGGEKDLPDLIYDSVWTLQKDGDKWKIINSVQLRITPLPPK